MLDFIFRASGPLVFEFGTRDYARLRQHLENNGRSLSARLARKPQKPFNHQVFTHIIGIERWSQRRMAVFDGQPFVAEEYDAYRPARESSWDDLLKAFEQARAQTVQIASQWSATPPDPRQRVDQGQWGALTAAGWLKYVLRHGEAESYKMR